MSKLYEILHGIIDKVNNIPSAISNALQQAKDSGEFKGDKGDTGAPGLAGKDGEDGDSGVYFGKDEPTDENVNVWVRDTDNSDNVLNFVSYTPQTLTPEQQAQARENIGIENIDLPTGNASQYRHIATIETSGGWKITQDEDGNAFSLSHVFIRADLTAVEKRSDGFLKFNGAAQLPWFFSAETSGYKATLEVMMVGDYLSMVYKNLSTGTKAIKVENYCHNHNSSESAITSIQHYTAAYPHGSGSKFEIWGY